MCNITLCAQCERTRKEIIYKREYLISFLMITKKVSSFISLRLNCWIIRVTWKWQMSFTLSKIHFKMSSYSVLFIYKKLCIAETYLGILSNLLGINFSKNCKSGPNRKTKHHHRTQQTKYKTSLWTSNFEILFEICKWNGISDVKQKKSILPSNSSYPN